MIVCFLMFDLSKRYKSDLDRMEDKSRYKNKSLNKRIKKKKHYRKNNLNTWAVKEATKQTCNK